MGRNILFYFIFISVSVIGGALGWDNSWDRFFWKECPRNQAFYRMKSQHDNGKEDRLFQFFCRHVGEYYEDDCTYTGWVNKLDGGMNFYCPNSGVVTGIQSFHSNKHEDREFKFKCCRVRKVSLTGCRTTGYLHGMDQPLDYTIPANNIIRGFNSYHANKQEDRRWRMHLCTKKTNTPIKQPTRGPPIRLTRKPIRFTIPPIKFPIRLPTRRPPIRVPIRVPTRRPPIRGPVRAPTRRPPIRGPVRAPARRVEQ